jgi:hypothetical protein
MNATTTAAKPTCSCQDHCAMCGAHHDPSRAIGWSRRYCSPLCEKRASEALADAFAAWWNRPRA